MAAPEHLCQPLHDSTLNIAHSSPSRHQRGPWATHSLQHFINIDHLPLHEHCEQDSEPLTNNEPHSANFIHQPWRHCVPSAVAAQTLHSFIDHQYGATTPLIKLDHTFPLCTIATHHSHSNHHFSYNLRINETRTHHKRCGARWKPCTSCTTHHKHTSAQLK